MSIHLRLLTLLLATLLPGVAASSAEAPSVTVSILYLGFTPPRTLPSTTLLPPAPSEEGVQGARLALAEETATGKFLGVAYDMQEALRSDEADLLEAARSAVATGRRVLVTDVPGPMLLRLADLPELKDALLLDVATSDDSLRGPDCRRNVLHVAPSRAMLADALMQYLVTKEWRRVLLLIGQTPPDKLYAEALRQSAKKFQIRIADERQWTFKPGGQQADTGHYQMNSQVSDVTAGVTYDVLVAADEARNFADFLAYRTREARPVAGSAGLVASAWAPLFDEYAGAQLQIRFRNRAKRPMTSLDYDAWAAVRAVGEAAVRGKSAEPAALAAFLRGPELQIAGYKGAPMSFRPWDGQLRQPILLTADGGPLVAISPQPGYLHQFNILDTLGFDRPESTCKF